MPPPIGCYNSHVSAIRHIVLSDLHLGALNSVLTNVAAGGGDVDVSAPAASLTALGGCLRSLAGGAEPPELIVLGDLFELALTPLDDAAGTFTHFVRAVGIGEHDGAVAPHVHYVAGNHDHQLWTRARLDQETALLEQAASSDPLLDAPHVTPMFPGGGTPVRSRFVEALVRRAETAGEVTVTHTYPNLAVAGPADQIVVMHHGHFVERLYRIVSSLDDLFGPPAFGRTVADLESDNAGWIDFFWSSEGDSGDAGTDVRMIYESLVSGRTIDDELARLGTLLVRTKRRPTGAVLRWIVERAVRRAYRRVGRAERHDGGGALSADAEAGLAMYLSGPVATELRSVYGTPPADTTFVFGHTHKPFVSTRDVAGYPRPLAVVNTGGWVVDHPEPEPLKGATAVLLDDHANVIAVELYRQRPDGTAEPPVVEPVSASSLPFADAVRARIDDDPHPWAEFTQAVSTALGARRQQLQERESATRRMVDDSK